MKHSEQNAQMERRLDMLESNMFRLAMVLLTGTFMVVGGLLSIIAALLVLAK